MKRKDALVLVVLKVVFLLGSLTSNKKIGRELSGKECKEHASVNCVSAKRCVLLSNPDGIDSEWVNNENVMQRQDVE